jgi:hypothetical protein
MHTAMYLKISHMCSLYNSGVSILSGFVLIVTMVSQWGALGLLSFCACDPVLVIRGSSSKYMEYLFGKLIAYIFRTTGQMQGINIAVFKTIGLTYHSIE